MIYSDFNIFLIFNFIKNIACKHQSYHILFTSTIVTFCFSNSSLCGGKQIWLLWNLALIIFEKLTKEDYKIKIIKVNMSLIFRVMVLNLFSHWSGVTYRRFLLHVKHWKSKWLILDMRYEFVWFFILFLSYIDLKLYMNYVF